MLNWGTEMPKFRGNVFGGHCSQGRLKRLPNPQILLSKGINQALPFIEYRIIFSGIKATLIIPKSWNGALIIQIPGFRGHRNAPGRVNFARKYLAANSFASLRFDFTDNTSMPSLREVSGRHMEELKRVLECALANIKPASIALYGNCLAANLALEIAADPMYSSRIKAVIALSPFGIPHEFAVESALLQKEMQADRRRNILAKIGIDASPEFMAELVAANMAGNVAKIPETTPVLFLVGNHDPLTGPIAVRPLFEAKKGRKEYVEFPGRSHGYINPQESRIVDESALAFLKTSL